MGADRMGGQLSNFRLLIPNSRRVIQATGKPASS